MRIPALAALAVAATLAMPGRAQTYDPRYPVCLHVYGPVGYYDCRYSSLGQCNIFATGRSAQCVANPYAAMTEPPRRVYRERHHAY